MNNSETPKNPEKERVPPTEAQEKILLCLSLVRKFILNLNKYHPSSPETKRRYQLHIGLLIPWQHFLIESLEKPLNIKEAQYLARLTAHLAELVATDDITGIRSGSLFMFTDSDESMRSSYGRQKPSDIYFQEFSALTNNFLTSSEIHAFFHEKIKTEENNLWVETKEELMDKMTTTYPETSRFYLRDPFSNIKEYQEFLDEYRKNKPDPKKNKGAAMCFAYAEVKISENVSCKVGFNSSGDNLDMWISATTTHHGVRQITTPIAKSEIWGSLLSIPYNRFHYDGEIKDFQEEISSEKDIAGYNLEEIGDKNIRKNIIEILKEVMPKSRKDDPLRFLLLLAKKQGIEDWQRAILYKKAVKTKRYDSLTQEGKQKYLEKTVKKHAAHYERLFTDSAAPRNKPDVSITRSGISANSAALMAAHEIFSQEKKSLPTVYKMYGWYFETPPPKNWEKTLPQEADILLMNIEPNPPFLEGDEKDFFKKRNKTLDLFLENVKSHPEKRFVIVMDKTTDLLNHSCLPKKNIPKNLIIIETASLTKHQRGGKSYFFGSIATWNNPLKREQMDECITTATGELTPDSIFALPRLSPREIHAQKEHNAKLSAIFKSVLETHQQERSPEKKWSWQPYNYFGFLIPPQKTIKEALLANPDRNKIVNSEVPMNIVAHFVDRNVPEAMSFDKGDSFGLNTTRFTSLAVPYPNQPNKNVSTVRIGFGRKTTETEMKTFAEFFCKELMERS